MNDRPSPPRPPGTPDETEAGKGLAVLHSEQRLSPETPTILEVEDDNPSASHRYV